MAQGCARESGSNQNVGKGPKRQATRLQLGATCAQLSDLRCAIAQVMGTWELPVVTKTLELVSRNYWWPGLSRYIAKFVAGCDVCNQTKTFPMQKVGKIGRAHV